MTMVTLGSPAVLVPRIRDFPSLPHDRYGFLFVWMKHYMELMGRQRSVMVGLLAGVAVPFGLSALARRAGGRPRSLVRARGSERLREGALSTLVAPCAPSRCLRAQHRGAPSRRAVRSNRSPAHRFARFATLIPTRRLGQRTALRLGPARWARVAAAEVGPGSVGSQRFIGRQATEARSVKSRTH